MSISQLFSIGMKGLLILSKCFQTLTAMQFALRNQLISFLTREKNLPKILEQEAQKLEPYFKFWKSTEIFDLKLRAKNYLVHEIITEDHGTTVKPYDPAHMQTRKLFGTALFAVDVSEVEIKNPYHEFEALTRRDGWQKIYTLLRQSDFAFQLSSIPFQSTGSRKTFGTGSFLV